MSDINIDPNLLIQDLMNQVNRLSSENTVLRVSVQQLQANLASANASIGATEQPVDVTEVD